LIEEPEDSENSEETIMAEEVVDGILGGRRGGNNGGNNGGGGDNNEINTEGDNSFGFPIIDEETHTTMKKISPSVLPNFYGL